MLFYSDKKISIYNSDILEKELFNPDSFDLTVTSPPYNVGIEYNSNDDTITYEKYLSWTKNWLENLLYWTKDTGRLCLNIPLDKNKGGKKSVGSDITQIAKDVGWSYQTTIIWNEGNISRRTAWGSWLSASAPYVIAPVELIVVFITKSGKKYKGESDITKRLWMAMDMALWEEKGRTPSPFPENS